MPRYSDPRTRSTTTLRSFSKDENLTLSKLAIPLIVQAIRVFALITSKEWLLDRLYGSTWLLPRTLLIVAVLVSLGWSLTGRTLPRFNYVSVVIPAVALFAQYWCLLAALSYLPVSTVLMFTHASSNWLTSLMSSSSPRQSLYTSLAFLVSALSTAYIPTTLTPNPSLRSASLPHLLLLGHACANYIYQRYLELLSHELRSTTAALTLANGGAAIIGIPLALLTALVPSANAVPIPYFSSLAILSILAISIVLPPTYPLTPKGAHLQSIKAVPTPISFLGQGIMSIFVSLIGFGHWPSFIDFVVGALLYNALVSSPTSSNSLTSRGDKADPEANSPLSPNQIQGYYNTVMSNPDSRKIAYFLALNLAFMGVQLTYGVWTNSLGLISDAIHMFFDCLAIGVGLLASIMATWPANERYTYGYGRIETLSGFANGIFLILISIFIVFEAIQRILDPPEMNTSQLLLVSSMGLGVNLFGMFAMGGHHHHGHGHSHGHDHGGHDHGHSHSHEHEHEHAHDHGHEHGHSHEQGHAHDHHREDDHGHDHHHDHEHNHAHVHSHSHSPTALTNGHAHDDHHHHHEHDHNHDHDHEHSGEDHHEHEHEHHHHHEHDDHDHDHSHSSHSSHEHSPTSPAHEHHHHDGHDHSHSNHSHGNGHDHHDHPHAHADDHGHDHNHGHEHSSHSHSHHEHEHEHEHGHSHSHDHVSSNHSHSAPSHSHSHDHHGHSHNMRGVFLHVMADTLGSVGVILSTILIQLYGWTGFDPIASLFIATLIVASVVPLVIDCGRVLSLDLGGNEDVVRRALSELAHVEGLKGYAHPRFWPKDAETIVGSITVLLARSSVDEHSLQAPLALVVKDVERVLRNGIPSLNELSIQVE